MYPGQAFLRRIGVEISPEAVTREQLIRRLRASGSHRIDGISPALHASLTVFSSELTVFLGYDSQQLIADLCDWYDCGDKWSYETKNAGQDHITNVWVNLIGATTPRLLQTTLPQDAFGGGLTARMIFINEIYKGKTVTIPSLEMELEEPLLHDLEQINMLAGEFSRTSEYLKLYSEWYESEEANPPFNDYRFDGYISRRATHVRKLSMIMSASRGDDMQLTVMDLRRAITELELAEKKMSTVFSGVGRSDLAGVTRAVMTTIATYKVISRGELQSKFIDDITSGELDEIIKALMAIEDEGKRFCRWKDPKNRIIEYIE